MRFSTLVFLGLFGAWVFQRQRACEIGHRLRAECHRAFASPESCESIPYDGNASVRVRELQGELDRLDRRGRDLERSLQAVTQSSRTLRELADRHRDEAVRAEYAEIEAGRARLAEMRDRNEVERVTVAARLQLARAGLSGDAATISFDDRRASPVEALSISARAR